LKTFNISITSRLIEGQLVWQLVSGLASLSYSMIVTGFDRDEIHEAGNEL